MPRVPTYESRVRSSPLPTPKVSPVDSGLGELAKGIGEVGKVVGDISADMEREREQQEDVEVSKLVREYEAFRNKKIDDKAEGLRTKVGTAAYAPDEKGEGADIRTMREIREFSSGLTKRPLSNRARAKLDGILAEKNLDTDLLINRYVADQTELAKKSEFKATAETLSNRMAAGEDVSTEEIDKTLAIVRSLVPSEEEFSSMRDDLHRLSVKSELDKYVAGRAPELIEMKLESEGVRSLLGAEANKYVKIAGELNKQITIEDAVTSTFSNPNVIYKKGEKGQEEPVAGWVDREKLMQEWLLKRRSIPVLDRDEADAVFKREMAAEAQLREAMIESKFNSALTEFNVANRTSDVNGDTAHWLKTHAPEEWQKLLAKEDQHRRWLIGNARANARERRLAARDGSSGVSSAEIDAMNELRHRLNIDPDYAVKIDPEKFKLEWETKLGSRYKEGSVLIFNTQKKFVQDPDSLIRARDVSMATARAVGRVGGSAKERKVTKSEIEHHIASTVAGIQAQGKVVLPEDIDAIADRYIAAKMDEEFKDRRRPRPPPSAALAPATVEPAPSTAPVAEEKPVTTFDRDFDAMLFGGKPTKTKAERIREIYASGVTDKTQIKAMLDSEGY